MIISYNFKNLVSSTVYKSLCSHTKHFVNNVEHFVFVLFMSHITVIRLYTMYSLTAGEWINDVIGDFYKVFFSSSSIWLKKIAEKKIIVQS